MTLIETVMAMGALGLVTLGIASTMNYFNHSVANADRGLDARELMRQVRYVMDSDQACSANFRNIHLDTSVTSAVDIPLARYDPATGTLSSQALVRPGMKFGGLIIQNARLIGQSQLSEDRYKVTYQITLTPSSTHGVGRTNHVELVPFSVGVDSSGKITQCYAPSKATMMSDEQAIAFCAEKFGTEAEYDLISKICVLPAPEPPPLEPGSNPTVTETTYPPGPDLRTEHTANFVNGIAVIMCPETTGGIDACKPVYPDGVPWSFKKCYNFVGQDGKVTEFCEDIPYIAWDYLKSGKGGCKCIMANDYMSLPNYSTILPGTLCRARCNPP